MDVYFSPSQMGFIPATWKSDGTYTENSWPEDAVLLTDKEASHFWKQTPPDGKMLGAADSRPTWVDLPAPTHEEMIAAAEQQKSTLKSAADAEIAWRQDAVDAGIATVEEAAALAEWKKYRVLLMRVDTAKAPGIDWPTSPGQQAS
ncbi:TPA: tail fiber assembly protein [Citrobacter braakii]|uniref:tail fiber assembly protein n=1 Tax=Citrobacter sp. W7 TaxID=2998571 RepID=UPI002DD65DC8|nr:tail fiber assembly protein [Citrobacter sp. W7]HCB1581536.1 tail fiber assembly protein [Citrobacter braakii]